MYILDEYQNLWNYTFVAVAIIAIAIGAFLEFRKMKKQDNKKNNDKKEI